MSMRTITKILDGAQPVASKIQTYICIITPEIAAELLKANDNIRAIKKAVVGRYVGDMLLDHWALTGQPLIFDWHGKLRDGQHRLESCVTSGRPFPTLVVVGVEPGVLLNIDCGAKRLLGDYLAHEQYSDAKSLGAAIRLAYQLIVEKNVTQNGYSPDVMLRWFSDGHTGLTADLAKVRLWEKKMPKGFTRSHMAAIRHYASDIIDVDDVDGFFSQVALAVDTIDTRSPAFVLRQFMTGSGRNSDKDRLQVPDRIGATINALNLFVAGHEATRAKIVWKRGGHNPQPFPQITPSVMAEFLDEEPEGAPA